MEAKAAPTVLGTISNDLVQQIIMAVELQSYDDWDMRSIRGGKVHTFSCDPYKLTCIVSHNDMRPSDPIRHNLFLMKDEEQYRVEGFDLNGLLFEINDGERRAIMVVNE